MKQFKHQDVLTIRKVFEGSMFVIPSFQRPYEWTQGQCEKLFDDIFDAFDNRNKKSEDERYFVGSLVMYEYGKGRNDEDDLQVNDDYRRQLAALEKSLKGRDRGLLKVVDGQQRLTSLLLLLVALRDCELNSGGMDGENLRYELEQLITDCKGRRGEEKNRELVRIRTNVLEDEPFELHLQDMYEAKGQYQELKGREWDRSKRFRNYRHFAALIEEKWGDPTAKGKDASKKCKERREFARFLVDNVQLLQLVCENRDDAFKLFEVVNSRGLELSQASIMKPRVVAVHSVKERQSVLRVWNKMCDEKEKNFLLNLFLYLRAIRMAESGKQDDSKKSIVDYFKDETPLKGNFVTLRKMYAIHCFTEDPRWAVLQSILDKFPLNLHRPAFYKFMLDLFENNSLFKEGRELEYDIAAGKGRLEDILKPAYEFCEQIIRFYLGNMLTGNFSRDEVRTKFKQLVVAVSQNDNNKMTFLSDIPVGLKEKIENFKVQDCYDEKQGISSNLSFVLVWLCTYLKYRDNLEEMERYARLFVRDDGKRIVPDREHVHPKDWSEHDGWTDANHKEKANLIGNLIPLELEINRTAGKDGLWKKITGTGTKSKAKLTYENSNSPDARAIAARYRNGELPNGWLPEHVDAATAEKIGLLKEFFGCK